MHIEPGIVDGAKMALSYGTAAAAGLYTLKLAVKEIKQYNPISFAVKALLASIAIFICFEILPHAPAGVSEVHFILGTTVMLFFGAAAAAVGLALGLMLQGIFFAPSDLPMLMVNVTTLLFPLFAMHEVARRIIPQDKAYVDLAYQDVLKLSAIYQGGIVAWVAFWAFYGQGMTVFSDVSTFAIAYLVVIMVEPIFDLGVLYVAKTMKNADKMTMMFTSRLHHPA